MIDWHSHILPEMDDGSRSTGESVSMLNLLREQGATHVVATPHFFANDESVDDFLERRKASYELLLQSVTPDCPKVVCGAEVRYYPGIVEMKELGSLAIENTKVLLLEMPMSKWTEYTIKELVDLAGIRGLTVVLAHIERYISFQSKGVLERLSDGGLLMQVNASCFKRFGSRHKALNLLKDGMVQFIGSDCHNLTTRAPDLKSAYDFVEKKLGKKYVYQMNEFGYQLLGHK